MAEMAELNKGPRTFKFLPLSLRIATLGGIATPLVLRGTPLPARRSHLFSTVNDNQEEVHLKVLMGESPIIKNNAEVQDFNLRGIPDAPRGEPQIIVTFEIDQTCNITASATEKRSGRSVSVEFHDAQNHLTDDKIRNLLRKAEAARAEDETFVKELEARNKANSLIDRAESRLREHQEQGVRPAEDRGIEEAVASLGLALETEDVDAILSKAEKLEKLLSTPAYGGFDSFLGGAGLFEDLFGEPKGKRPAGTRTQKPFTGQKRAEDQLTTSRRTTGQIGKIFGGGEFTLDTNLCFILMPFKDNMRSIYDDHIRPVVEAEGLSCLRADEIVSTNLITRDVWEKINRARFLIADVTGKNANVFYEIGLAHALGKDIILITQTMNDVPFDLKGLRCIVYSFTPRGVRELEAKLRETVREIMKSS